MADTASGGVSRFTYGKNMADGTCTVPEQDVRMALFDSGEGLPFAGEDGA